MSSVTAGFEQQKINDYFFLSLRHCPAVIVCPNRDIQVNMTNINYENQVLFLLDKLVNIYFLLDHLIRPTAAGSLRIAS